MKKLVGIMFLFVLFLTACSSATGGKDSITPDKVIVAFKGAGLEAEDSRKMTKDDYGVAPMKAEEGKLIILPSVCEDCGARIFNYENDKDLDEMKAYYDDLGKESAMLFSWTIKHKNILVQLNGDLPEEEYNKYVKALEEL
jgi:hypothetical protein